MWKYCVAAFLCLISIEKALGLNCYVTDVEKLQQNRNPKNLTSKLENCEKYTQEALERQRQARIATGTTVEFSCYNMVLDAAGSLVEFKGCMMKDGCEEIERTIGGLMQIFGAGQLKCSACNADGCNSGSRFFVSGFFAFLLVAIVSRM